MWREVGRGTKIRMGQCARWVMAVRDRHGTVIGEGMAGSKAPSPRPPSIFIAIDDWHTLCKTWGWEENRKSIRLVGPVDRGGGGPF